jgi:hypothetical protein
MNEESELANLIAEYERADVQENTAEWYTLRSLNVEQLVGMADAAVGEVLTGNDYARYHKAIRQHFRARLLRAAEYARLRNAAIPEGQ